MASGVRGNGCWPESPAGGIIIIGGALWKRNEPHRSTPPLTKLTRYLRSSGSISTILRLDAIRVETQRRLRYCARVETHCSGGSRSWRPALLCRKENISKPRSKRIENESGFPHHLARVLVISEADGLRVPQMIGTRPLEELDLCHQDTGARPSLAAVPLGSLKATSWRVEPQWARQPSTVSLQCFAGFSNWPMSGRKFSAVRSSLAILSCTRFVIPC
jgi:hypothetical protein